MKNSISCELECKKWITYGFICYVISRGKCSCIFLRKSSCMKKFWSCIGVIKLDMVCLCFKFQFMYIRGEKSSCM